MSLPAPSTFLSCAGGAAPDVSALSLASASFLCLWFESPGVTAGRLGSDSLEGACLPLSMGCGALLFSATILLGALNVLVRLESKWVGTFMSELLLLAATVAWALCWIFAIMPRPVSLFLDSPGMKV